MVKAQTTALNAYTIASRLSDLSALSRRPFPDNYNFTLGYALRAAVQRITDE